MPWFSLIADGSRSCDRLPAISGEWAKPSSRASPSFRGLTHSPERPEQPKPRLQKNLGTGIDEQQRQLQKQSSTTH
jgi:hypothetical protein